MLRRQKINQVLKIIMETGQWHGYIVACKVNEWHINHGWHIGYKIRFDKDELIEEYDENAKYMAYSQLYIPTNDDNHKIVTMVQNTRRDYEYYNCNYELGYYAVFYQEV